LCTETHSQICAFPVAIGRIVYMASAWQNAVNDPIAKIDPDRAILARSKAGG
jgi:hypothetical protein